MYPNPLSAALEREHREIDGGIEAYLVGPRGGVADPAPLRRAISGLRRHIYLEEEFIFPPLKAAGMMMPIFVMLREHGELWDAMAEIDELLSSAADPAALQEACQDLLARLDAHNSKEEPVIYPQADAQLSDEESARLRELLAEGRMPEGWRCERAAT